MCAKFLGHVEEGSMAVELSGLALAVRALRLFAVTPRAIWPQLQEDDLQLLDSPSSVVTRWYLLVVAGDLALL